MKHNQAVTARAGDWADACLAAAHDDSRFLNFRSEQVFIRVVEGSSIEAGLYNLRRLLRNDPFNNCLPLLQLSDSLGHPQRLIPFRVRDAFYSLSPTTLRYANNVVNVMNLFGEDLLRGGSIHEIGGGYGGEAAVFNHFAVSQFGTSIGNRWKLYDLPTSRPLIARFLQVFQYRVSLLTDLENVGQPDLVISNGALSEMWGETLRDYMDAVVFPAKRGYFMTNFETHSLPMGGISTDEFIISLRRMGKVDAMVLPTRSFLSHFDDEVGTKLVVFGAGADPNRRTTARQHRGAFALASLRRLRRFHEVSEEIYLGSFFPRLRTKLSSTRT